MREFKCLKTVVMFNFLEVNNEDMCSEQFIMLLYRKQCLHKGKNIRFHMFFKVNVLKNLQNFTGKHQCWRLLLIKLWALRPRTLLKRTPAPESSSETFKNTFFTKHFQWLLLEGVGEGATLVKICRFNIFGINCRCFRKMLNE